jgi:hypothetical protein
VQIIIIWLLLSLSNLIKAPMAGVDITAWTTANSRKTAFNRSAISLLGAEDVVLESLWASDFSTRWKLSNVTRETPELKLLNFVKLKLLQVAKCRL